MNRFGSGPYRTAAVAAAAAAAAGASTAAVTAAAAAGTMPDRWPAVQEDMGEPWASRHAESVTKTLRMLEALLQALQEAGGWPRHRIHLFGFSQVDRDHAIAGEDG